MMRCKWWLAMCVVAGMCAAGAWAQVPLFHVPFEGSADALRSGGRGSPLAAEKLEFVPGAAGQGVAMKPGALLEYAVDGNLVQERGTLMMWFKPNWRAADMDASTSREWHCLFSQRLPEGKERIGSGMLWLWFWGSSLRGDISDAADLYKTAGSGGMDRQSWAHIAFTWDVERGSRMYFNGVPVGSPNDGYSPLKLGKENNYEALRNRFESFFIGSQGNWQYADGTIDELMIFDKVLTAPEITTVMGKVAPLHLDSLSGYVLEPAAPGTQTQLRWSLTNITHQPVSAGATWKLMRGEEVVAEGRTDGRSIAPGERSETTVPVPALAKGQYKLIVQSPTGPHRSADIHVLSRGNPYLGDPGEIRPEPLETIDFAKGVAPERLVVRGETRTGTLDGRPYFEAGVKKNDRFAVHVTLPEAGVPYVVEWDYPDDKLRTMEMVAHDALNPGSDYAMQTGVFCGGEYANSMRTLTHRSILWPRARDMAFIFMTTREGEPAAVSELRISKLTRLPDANIRDAAPVAGWTRSVGIHFEDPALGYDFGVQGQLMPEYEKTLDRLVAYMKWSGQNLLSYPAVWYHGRINMSYQPRHHEDDFIGCILAKFEPQQLGFMAAINLQNIAVPEDVKINEQSMGDGSLHDSPVMILATGKPNPGGWHGTPPNFNPLHPAVRGYVDAQVDDLLVRYGDSPAFKGIVLHLTKHTIPWFGSIEAGYNDYVIDAFERDTGIRVPVDRAEPLRGKLYYEWLMANAREPWVQWRCRQIAAWYKAIADRISARRPDLKLSLFSYNPTVTDFAGDPRYGTPGFTLTVNRESGIDPALYADAGNIILAQSIYPSDYRWKGERDEKTRATLMIAHAQPDTYALTQSAGFPWVNMHDRYFEDGIGGGRWWGKNDPLKADWLKETPWRVSVLNASERHFLEHYILPLRYGDVLGFTKGGFLIGTLGVEDKLLEFARALRSLPAERFADLPGSTDTIKVRALQKQGIAWLYIANTEHREAAVTLEFTAAPERRRDLAAGRDLPLTGNTLRLTLKPYELRALQLDRAPSAVRCE
jgi:hypothetical protein